MLSLTERSPRVSSIRDNSFFARKILNFMHKCVVPIITHYSPLDDTQYVYNVELSFLILTICIF